MTDPETHPDLIKVMVDGQEVSLEHPAQGCVHLVVVTGQHGLRSIEELDAVRGIGRSLSCRGDRYWLILANVPVDDAPKVIDSMVPDILYALGIVFADGRCVDRVPPALADVRAVLDGRGS